MEWLGLIELENPLLGGSGDQQRLGSEALDLGDGGLIEDNWSDKREGKQLSQAGKSWAKLAHKNAGGREF